MTITHLIYVGIKGSVVALHRDTGAVVWESRLPGMTFVNLAGDGDRVFALSNGEIFCLNARDGRVLWQNPLKGFGLGFGAILVPSSEGNSVAGIVAQIAAQPASANTAP